MKEFDLNEKRGSLKKDGLLVLVVPGGGIMS